MHKRVLAFAVLLLAGHTALYAGIELTTLPSRDEVQLTIYNSADLTLVRDQRALTLEKGRNRLQFSWADTLIDPTSLELLPEAYREDIIIRDLAYPARTKHLGVWTIDSERGGEVPMEITYLTSGLSWRAFYMGTLTPDEQALRLQGYVRITNYSGEDYANAQTRLVVGKINLVDQIVLLARRDHPYGRPSTPLVMRGLFAGRSSGGRGAAFDDFFGDINVPTEEIKSIKKEGLSEYFLYTIEGTETIPSRWSKRLPSFETEGIPVINLYKYEEERYGTEPVRFLSFKNDEAHELGETPIPGGTLRIYRDTGDESHLSYTGQSTFKYIPVGEEVELNLGATADVLVEPRTMKFATDDYLFNNKGNITGWRETRDIEIEVTNTRDLPVRIEITRNFPTSYWTLKTAGDGGDYRKVDRDTVRFTLDLEPGERRTFGYTLTTAMGSRRDE